jgi:hypothetical protein
MGNPRRSEIAIAKYNKGEGFALCARRFLRA